MKFNFINTSILVSGLFVSSLASADTIAVKHGIIFFLNGTTLAAQSLSGSLPSGCITPLAANLSASSAKELVISGNYAVVAPGLSTPVDVINISSCLSGTDDSEAKADVQEGGKLEIPCLNVEEKIYNVIMKQRGNSMNWEVEFVEPVTGESCDN